MLARAIVPDPQPTAAVGWGTRNAAADRARARIRASYNLSDRVLLSEKQLSLVQELAVLDKELAWRDGFANVRDIMSTMPAVDTCPTCKRKLPKTK